MSGNGFLKVPAALAGRYWVLDGKGRLRLRFGNPVSSAAALTLNVLLHLGAGVRDGPGGPPPVDPPPVVVEPPSAVIPVSKLFPVDAVRVFAPTVSVTTAADTKRFPEDAVRVFEPTAPSATTPTENPIPQTKQFPADAVRRFS